MSDKKEDKVAEVLQKTHDQVGHADEGKKIHYAKEHAGFFGWMTSNFGKLSSENFRTMIEGKNLMLAKKRSKE